jgi:type III secretory pathway component EscT
MPDFSELISVFTREAGADPRAWLLAWARVLPAVSIVPAFGLGALPGAPRLALGFAMAFGIAPAVRPLASNADLLPAFASELAKGVPVAVTAALVLWTATMAGGLMDELRGSRQPSALTNVDSGASPLGALLSMLVALVFLQAGGAARIVEALAEPNLSVGVVEGIARRLTNAVELAVAVGAPVLVSTIILELAFALVHRIAQPAFLEPIFAPLRSFALLALSALLLERIAEFLALQAQLQTLR